MIVAVFDSEEAAREAKRALAADWRCELHTGQAPEDAPASGGPATRRVGWAAAAGALLGAAIAVLVQWWSTSIAYPLSIGGRTPPAWETYVPAAIAVAMFWSVGAGFLAFLFGSRLPQLHHPFFESGVHGELHGGAALLAIEADPSESSIIATRLAANPPRTIEVAQ